MSNSPGAAGVNSQWFKFNSTGVNSQPIKHWWCVTKLRSVQTDPAPSRNYPQILPKPGDLMFLAVGPSLWTPLGRFGQLLRHLASSSGIWPASSVGSGLLRLFAGGGGSAALHPLRTWPNASGTGQMPPELAKSSQLRPPLGQTAENLIFSETLCNR